MDGWMQYVPKRNIIRRWLLAEGEEEEKEEHMPTLDQKYWSILIDQMPRTPQ
jgi:hypothetical protein